MCGKSYPDFWDVYKRLGGAVDEFNGVKGIEYHYLASPWRGSRVTIDGVTPGLVLVGLHKMKCKEGCQEKTCYPPPGENPIILKC